MVWAALLCWVLLAWPEHNVEAKTEFRNGFAYTVHLTRVEEPTARATCTSDGSILSTAKDQEENDFLRSIIESAVWLGLSDIDEENTWVSSDGKVATWTNWNENEPNNDRSVEDCVVMLPDSNKWNDAPCTNSYRYPFVCKRPMEICPVGKFGSDCHKTCSKTCGGDGTCFATTGACLYGCRDGYHGAFCTNCKGEDCKNICSKQCAGDGSCDLQTGACTHGCKDGYATPLCTDCIAGRYGPTCSLNCSKQCGGDGSCNQQTGECTQGCQDGFATHMCSVCEVGRYGSECRQNCSEFCVLTGLHANESPCHNKSGICVLGCQSGYEGPQCTSVCKSGKYGPGCRHDCGKFCDIIGLEPTESPCDHINGTCVLGCQNGYEPPQCTDVCSGGTYGPGCSQVCSEHCAGDGSCIPQTGECVHGCHDGSMGALCTACPSGKFGRDCRHSCSEFCNVAGLEPTDPPCHRVSGVCVLGCQSGYELPLCTDVPVPCNQSRTAGSTEVVTGQGIAVGLAVALLAVAVVAVGVYLWRKKLVSQRAERNQDLEHSDLCEMDEPMKYETLPKPDTA